MKRILALVMALGAIGLLAVDADAHGGSFRGPSGGVPPGMREPSDPEPPPPPPSDPGDPGGPTTPPSDPSGPTTPSPEPSGPDTDPGGAPPPPVGPTSGPTRGKTTTKSLTYESWRFWWGYNNDDILNLKSHIYGSKVSSTSPLFFTSKRDQENRQNAQRPTEAAVRKTIIPALERSINRKDDHSDIHGGALVALGKIGGAAHIDLLKKCANNEYRNPKGVKIDFGNDATESAVLALGLLRDLDESAKKEVREALLEIITDENRKHYRDRVWAAVSLGLQRDRQAIRPLMELAGKKFPKDDLYGGILAGLGLIGDDENGTVRKFLEDAFIKGSLSGRDISSNDRVRAFAGYALGKLGDPASLEAVTKMLTSRNTGKLPRQSAAIAAGILASKAGDEEKKKAVDALQKYLRGKQSDASGENFAIIALSQIGTDPAIDTLLELADGKYGQRSFAALGLGTYVFYKEREKEEGTGPGLAKDMKDKIVDRLIKLAKKNKDSDTKAAFMLARGLVRDESAIDECVEIVAKTNNDPVLRGYCSVALGIIGKPTENVKFALKAALDDRKNDDLRRDAATGLSLLHDAEVVKLLIDKLKDAKSFAVQGQLITAIGTIGDHTAIDPLVNLLDDPGQPAQTRAMAAVGLGMIGDLRLIPALAGLSKNYNYRASLPDIDELLFIL